MTLPAVQRLLPGAGSLAVAHVRDQGLAWPTSQVGCRSRCWRRWPLMSMAIRPMLGVGLIPADRPGSTLFRFEDAVLPAIAVPRHELLALWQGARIGPRTSSKRIDSLALQALTEVASVGGWPDARSSKAANGLDDNTRTMMASRLSGIRLFCASSRRSSRTATPAVLGPRAPDLTYDATASARPDFEENPDVVRASAR